MCNVLFSFKEIGGPGGFRERSGRSLGELPGSFYEGFGGFLQVLEVLRMFGMALCDFERF